MTIRIDRAPAEGRARTGRATALIRADFGTVSLSLRADAAETQARADDVSRVLRALPGWLRDSALRPSLLRLFEELHGHLALSRGGIVLDLFPALARAIEDGRVHVDIGDARLPAPVLVAPGVNDATVHPGSTPVDETTWFQVRFLDEVGAPIDGLDVTFSVLGSPRKATTNDAGIARLEKETVSTAQVTVKDTNALRDKLRPRWSEPRTPKIAGGPDTYVRQLDVVFDPAGLEAEVPATIVITPYFRCREVAGAHFEFGRSFVRRDAIPILADIAEDLHGEPVRRAMLFAHSDKAGSDALNKELSERRAKAVFALLVHDASAWEELWTNAWSGGNWSEIWGTREAQHMLKALDVPTEDGSPLAENGSLDARTTAAVKRFQRGEYPSRPGEQAALVDDGVVGPLTRKELFLAYAKLVTRKPLPIDRIAQVNGEKYMGCGEYNPLSLSTKDAESRRVVLLVFDVAAQPQGLPCKLRSLGPCKGNVGPELKDPDPEGKPPYRCKVYQEVAKLCPCQCGAELNHDLILRIPVTLEEANGLPHVFVLESEDMTITMSRSLAADARAEESGWVEIFFPDLPPMHSYRMRCEGTEEPYEVFDLTPYPELHAVGRGGATPEEDPFLAPAAGGVA